MVGIVLVSHSDLVARGAALLARQMGGEDVAIEATGGLDEPDRPIGTDAVQVAAAIERAWSPDGVLVLMDLGSAVLSAEMALDLLPEERRAGVTLVSAPLVEGAVAGGGPPPPPPPAAAPPAVPAPAVDGSRTAVLPIRLPHGLHARPAARFVQAVARSGADVTVRNLTTGAGPVSGRSLNGVATLGVLVGHEVEVTATGPSAEAAIAALIDLAERDFDEAPEAAPPVRGAETSPIPAGAIAGIASSPGVAVGPATRFRVDAPTIPTTPATDDEREVLRRAIEATRADIVTQRDDVTRRSGAAAAAIFEAHLLFLDDAAMVGPATAAIAAGTNAARAWNDASETVASAWAHLDDPYLRARAADVRSVAAQVVAHALQAPAPRPHLDRPGVLVAEDLSPSDAAALDPASALGVALAAGGPTSHAAVLTRALGIPCAVGLGPELLQVADGTPLALDGDAGYVVVAPDVATTEAFARRRAEASASDAADRAAAREPGRLADGTAVEVSANIGAPSEVAAAMEAGCDGVGLFRTEILFMGRTEMPTEDEQMAAYAAAADALEGRPLVIRTLDVGADKPLPYLRQEAEANPFLGLRGLRLGLARPELLDTQVRAILRAARGRRIRIMFPMVATRAEVLAARAAVDRARDGLGSSAGTVEFGIMIEVPAAVLTAEHLAPLVDFFSVGTNDLTQYVFAAERGNPRVATVADPLHPAVLRLIGATARSASEHGRWTGVCGELAADPLAAPLLVGLGVRELSMGAPAIPRVKRVLRATDPDRARALAERATALPDATAVRELLRGEMPGA